MLPMKSMPGATCEQLERLLAQRVALAGLLADRQQADLRRGQPEAVAGVDRAHLGELDEPLGLHLGVGAGVEQHRRRRAGHRDRGGDGRAADALDAAHAQQRRRPSWRRCCRPRSSPTALPSRTASAARTSVESFLRRTAWAGSSSMAMTSLAAISGRSPSRRAARSAGPTSTIGTPAAAAWRAPATISPGARSPPMASTAMGSIEPAEASEDQALTSTATRPLYQPQRGAHGVRLLGVAAAGADAARRGGQLPGAGATATGLRLRLLLLGNGHRALRLGIRLLQASGRRVHARRVSRHRVLAGRSARSTRGQSSRRSWSRAAQRSSRTAVSQSHGSTWRSAPQTGHRPGAVVAAQRGVGDAEQDVLADHRGEVELAVLDRERLRVDAALAVSSAAA